MVILGPILGPILARSKGDKSSKVAKWGPKMGPQKWSFGTHFEHPAEKGVQIQVLRKGLKMDPKYDPSPGPLLAR